MNRSTRRSFLRGAAGFALAVPFLPSLAPHEAQADASTRPERFITMRTGQGPLYRDFWPSVDGVAETVDAGNVRRYPLSDIAGDLSPNWNARFDPFRSRLLFLKRLDPTCPHNHNSSVALGGWSDDERFTYQTVRAPHRTIDRIIADHIYPAEPAGPRVLSFGTVSYGPAPSISYDVGPGGLTIMPVREDPIAAFTELFAGVDPDAGADERARRQALDVFVADRVLEDYRAVVGSSRISYLDRQRLDGHVDLLFQLQQRLQNQTVSAECIAPEQPGESNTYFAPHVAVRDQLDLILAAVRCDLSRVINMSIHLEHIQSFLGTTDGYHALAHASDSGLLRELSQVEDWNVEQFAYLLEGLDAALGPDGESLLDSSLLFYTKELASETTHQNRCQPAVLAGGRCIASGQLIDYRTEQRRSDYSEYVGRAYGELLTTIMTAMGLTRAQWEPDTGDRVGDWAFHHSYTEESVASDGPHAVLPGALI